MYVTDIKLMLQASEDDLIVLFFFCRRLMVFASARRVKRKYIFMVKQKTKQTKTKRWEPCMIVSLVSHNWSQGWVVPRTIFGGGMEKKGEKTKRKNCDIRTTLKRWEAVTHWRRRRNSLCDPSNTQRMQWGQGVRWWWWWGKSWLNKTLLTPCTRKKRGDWD